MRAKREPRSSKENSYCQQPDPDIFYKGGADNAYLLDEVQPEESLNEVFTYENNLENTAFSIYPERVSDNE